MAQLQANNYSEASQEVAEFVLSNIAVGNLSTDLRIKLMQLAASDLISVKEITIHLQENEFSEESISFVEDLVSNINSSPNIDTSDSFGSSSKPLEEHNNKSTGIVRLWDMSQQTNKEIFGVLTKDGAILITQVLQSSSGGITGIYSHETKTHHQYPTNQGVPSRVYAGMIMSAGRYFIPINATIHSHTPCSTDGTDRVSNQVINDDRSFASNHPNANHYIIGCGASAQFDGSSNQAYNIRFGTPSALSNNIN